MTLGLAFALDLVEGLRERIAELEQREYRGVWRSDESYKAGSMVTCAGSLWTAQIDSKGVRPGDGSSWKLTVKRGRD